MWKNFRQIEVEENFPKKPVVRKIPETKNTICIDGLTLCQFMQCLCMNGL